MENKKILNATSTEYDGIKFKSILEKNVYKTLKTEGLDVRYEPETFTLWESHEAEILYYNRFKNLKTKLKTFGRMRYKIRGITHTPDFMFDFNGRKVILEAKGFANDRFYIVQKLFIGYLEKNMPDAIYAEVFSIKDVKKLLEILRDEKTE